MHVGGSMRTVCVNLTAAVGCGDLTSDGVHPARSGALAMAHAWHEALRTHLPIVRDAAERWTERKRLSVAGGGTDGGRGGGVTDGASPRAAARPPRKKRGSRRFGKKKKLKKRRDEAHPSSALRLQLPAF